MYGGWLDVVSHAKVERREERSLLFLHARKTTFYSSNERSKDEAETDQRLDFESRQRKQQSCAKATFAACNVQCVISELKLPAT